MSINRVHATPFAQIANAMLRDKRLSFKARGVLSMVLSHSGEWEASRDWIIEQSEKDGREAVQAALNELTELGYRSVSKERLADGTFRTVVDWHQQPTEDGFPAKNQESQARTGDGLSDRRETRPPVEPSAGEPVGLSEHHLQNNTPSPGDTSPLTEFSLLPSEIVKQRVAKAKAKRDYAFDEWWAIVPKKVDKGHAERAYRKALTKTTHATLMQATSDLIGWNALGPRQYMPNPATWLNGERWADETAPKVGTPIRGNAASGVLIPDDNYSRQAPIDYQALYDAQRND